MQRIMLKSKIHRARITGTQLHYAGSIAIDQTLMEAADLLPGEQVHVLNVNNGARCVTYVIAAPEGSGQMALKGAAARLGEVGDEIIVLSYCHLAEAEQAGYEARVVRVDESNRPLS